MNDALSPGVAMHPLIARLFVEHAYARVDAGSLDAFANAAGAAVLFFSEDPKQYKETLDLAVILPEIAKAYPGRFRIGVLLPADARALAPRYGVRRWPALVMLRGGAYVGAIEGLRDWSEYLAETEALLAAMPSRPPIPLHVAGGPPACS